MALSLFCMAKSDDIARSIVEELEVSGIFSTHVSVLVPAKVETAIATRDHHAEWPPGSPTLTAVGGILGGAIGWMAGLGSLAIPGIGPFIAAGPLMSAISGAAIGAAVGGVAGILIGLGIAKSEADRYEERIRSGSILISVHQINDREVRLVKGIFSGEGAEDIVAIPAAPGDAP
jgi:hypothetical protein